MSKQQIHITSYVHHGIAAETSRTPTWTALDAIALPLLRMLTRLIRERALRRAENELMGLDDRTLRDFGFSRNVTASAACNSNGERLSGARRPMLDIH